VVDHRFMDPNGLFQQALAWHFGGEVDKAIGIYRWLHECYPNDLQVLIVWADAELRKGRAGDALTIVNKAIRLDASVPMAHNLKGNALVRLSRNTEALESFDTALRCDAKSVEACCNKGALLIELKRWQEALPCFDRAIEVRPDFAPAHNNRGVVLQQLDRHAEAEACFIEAARVDAGFADAHFNLGCLQEKDGRLYEALAAYRKAVEVMPSFAGAYSNLGGVLFKLSRFAEALDCLAQARSLQPACAETYAKIGYALKAMMRHEEALRCFDQALDIDADAALAHTGRGDVLRELRQDADALVSYQAAFQLNPSADFVLGSLALAKLTLCDWSGVDTLRASLVREDLLGAVSSPFPAQVLLDALSVQMRCAAAFIDRLYPQRGALVREAASMAPGRIRVGYFSSDFGDHPVSHLLAGVFEHHDRTHFEIFGFSLSERQDEWRARVEAGFDHFIELGSVGKSDAEIAQAVAEFSLDIAVDLNGHTFKARTGVFAERVAPIQVGYIGFLGTMGAPYIDYLVADPVLVPEDKRAFYQEKIAYLPWYQSNDDKTEVSDRSFSRTELGLPEEGIVYASFNNNYKITPDVFDSWMRILKQVPGSVLWLFAANEIAVGNLRREARARDVDDARLIFAERMQLKQHLVRQRAADLFLDTFPYNAGATASNALRMGLPVLTRSGESFASRYGASLLAAVGMPELTTESVEDYEAMAVRLGRDPAALAALRAKLLANLPTAPLFDTAAFTRNIEVAFLKMVERQRAGLAPDHIFV